MLDSWFTLVPPLIVIFAAYATRKIHLALFFGIAAASIVASKGAIAASLSLATTSLFDTATDLDNLFLYAFLIAIGTLVSLFATTGAATSFAMAVTQKICSARKVQYASMLVSSLLFIDDYLSILTTGYVISPLTDRCNISREKLAFLVHSLAGPIVILAPVSSWVATIINYLDQVGITTDPEQGIARVAADPFFIYLKTIPYIFYSFLVILSVWFIIHARISYGPMKEYDKQAEECTEGPAPTQCQAYTSNLLFPLFVLVLGIVVGLPLAGGFWLFGGSHTLIESLKYNEHPFLVMFISAVLAVIVGFIRCYQRNLIAIKQIPDLLKDGYGLMISAIVMVYLAATFSGMLADHVGTGQYLASLFIGSVPLWMLPTMFFIVSLICTIATGSAWGNFALMIPIAVPMITTLSGLVKPIDPAALPLLLPILGAIFSGSVCGDHISPLSETTFMAATSTGTRPIVHSYTQLPYAIPAILGCFVSFSLAGILSTLPALVSLGISLSAGALISIGLLWYWNKN